MKKNYIQPSLYVKKVKINNILAGSDVSVIKNADGSEVEINGNETGFEGAAKQGGSFDWGSSDEENNNE